MPKPRYIVCSDSISQDRGTNLLSLFHVIDGLTAVKTGQASDGSVAASDHPGNPVRLCCVAVWERTDPETADTEFEHSLTIEGPGNFHLESPTGTFRFTSRYHRFVVRIGSPTPTDVVSGDVVFRSTVTGKDGDSWSQEYSIPVEVVEP